MAQAPNAVESGLDAFAVMLRHELDFIIKILTGRGESKFLENGGVLVFCDRGARHDRVVLVWLVEVVFSIPLCVRS